MKAFLQISVLLAGFTLTITQCSKINPEDIVNIPDSHFKTALIEQGIDKNRDGIITFEEAESIYTIDLWGKGVSDLSGVEAFINLDTLRAYLNPLGTMDLSENRSLRVLECVGCELTALNLSKNTELKYLDCSGSSKESFISVLNVSNNSKLEYLQCELNLIETLILPEKSSLRTLKCGRNKLTTIDVSSEALLTTFTCNNNLLTELDISSNTGLTKMISCGNQLTFLDISNNTKLLLAGFDNMPMLTEVCVWTLPFPPAGVSLLMGFSPNVVFTTGCGE